MQRPGKSFDRRQQKCARKIRRKYKFVIAFENSMCQDYLTEKPYDALELVRLILKTWHDKCSLQNGKVKLFFITASQYKTKLTEIEINTLCIKTF